MELERRLQRIARSTLAGLTGLAVYALAAAAHTAGTELGWFAEDSPVGRILLIVWVGASSVSAMGFGVAFVLGRRLDARQRRMGSDELEVLVSRRAAVRAFVGMLITAVVVAAIPAGAQLPGNSVALLVLGVAAAILALGRRGGEVS